MTPEQPSGTAKPRQSDQTNDPLAASYDVVVIGGGAAGLNGALMLGRSRRSVVVLDSGRPRNAPAAAVHGLLGHDGISPDDLVARGRHEVRTYGGHVVTAEVTRAAVVDDGFEVSLADGREVRARRLLVTTGLVDGLPDVAGLGERFGRDVLHCPYCHGWEVRDRAIGILATGPMAMHQVLLFRQLSADVVLFTHEQPDLGPEDAEKLAALDVPVVTGTVGGIEVADDALTGVRMADGRVISLEAVAVGTRMTARADVLTSLGLAMQEHPSGMGDHVAVDVTGRTSVAGVWAAGNVADISAQVGAAAAAGAMAGAQINADLVLEDTSRAVASYRLAGAPTGGGAPGGARSLAGSGSSGAARRARP